MDHNSVNAFSQRVVYAHIAITLCMRYVRRVLTNQTMVIHRLISHMGYLSLDILHMNNHAPIKSKRVKSQRMPDWFTPDIIQMQFLRDKTKTIKAIE